MRFGSGYCGRVGGGATVASRSFQRDDAGMHRPHRIYAFLIFLGLAAPASAQADPQLTLATLLEQGPALAASLPKVLWQPDGHKATVVRTSKAGNQAMHRFADGKVAAEPWFTAAEVLATLPKHKDSNAKGPMRFPAMQWHDARTLRLLHNSAAWHWQVGAKKAQRMLSWQMPDATLLELAPNDGHAAVRSAQQLFVLDRSGARHQITFDGCEDLVYGGAAHRAEIGITKGTFWRQDGRYLAFYREDQRPIARYPYQDVRAMPPTLRHGRYPMAGRKDSSVRVRVCDTKTYRTVELEAETGADLYWTNVTFGPDDTVMVTLVNRGQDQLKLVRFDAKTGKRLHTVLTEQDRQWVEPEHPVHYLQDGRFLWWSRRSGYRHIYLHEANGKLVRQVTSGNCDVLSLRLLEDDESHVWYQASGNDPRQHHLFVASLADGSQRQVTTERGSHDCKPSPDGKRAFVVWSNLESKPQARVLDTDTGTATTLPGGTDPLAKFTLPKQQFFEVEASDGSRLYGHVAIPADLKPGQRAPVIQYVYGGPHAQLVKDQWFGGAATWLQALCGSGFIICRLDNRGTPNRGIEFEQKIHRRLGTPEVEDQLRAVDWLRQQTFVDPDRIGVHGWSFGGYMTLRLMLLHPNVYTCGISGAPVTDWAMYETGYSERYMDSPRENPTGFQNSSCLPLAKSLNRPLLVVHGTDDRTVMWSHTLKFVEACVQAGKPLDYFPYPQQLHGLRGPHRKHFLNKLHSWFTRHLK